MEAFAAEFIVFLLDFQAFVCYIISMCVFLTKNPENEVRNMSQNETLPRAYEPAEVEKYWFPRWEEGPVALAQ